jgi:hypothetical protein
MDVDAVATPAWDALESLRRDGETLTIAELRIYLEGATGLRWPVRRVERLVPAAYRAHGMKGQSPIRYRRGVWGAP